MSSSWNDVFLYKFFYYNIFPQTPDLRDLSLVKIFKKIQDNFKQKLAFNNDPYARSTLIM